MPHIKRRCHESASSSTGSLTIAELTAYKAVHMSFNGGGFLLGLVEVFEVSKMPYVCLMSK